MSLGGNNKQSLHTLSGFTGLPGFFGFNVIGVKITFPSMKQCQVGMPTRAEM